MSNDLRIITDISSYSPVPFSPRSSSPEGDSKISKVGKRRFGDEDNFSSGSSSPFTSNSISPCDRETPSPSKKGKLKPKIQWIDASGSGKSTPVSSTIACTYRVIHSKSPDLEATDLETSGCPSVDASELWNNPLLYAYNKDQPFDEDSVNEAPKAIPLKRSIKSGSLCTDDDLVEIFRSLDVKSSEESIEAEGDFF